MDALGWVVAVARCIGGAELNRQKHEGEKTSLPNYTSAPHFLTVILAKSRSIR